MDSTADINFCRSAPSREFSHFQRTSGPRVFVAIHNRSELYRNDAVLISDQATPFSVSGTADELDEQLPQALVQFVGKHLELKNTLEAAKAEMDAAAKQAKEEAKLKTVAVVKKPEPPPAKPEPAKPAPSLGLFDTLPAEVEPTPTSSDEDEILKEIQANEQSDDDTEDDLEDEPAAA